VKIIYNNIFNERVLNIVTYFILLETRQVIALLCE